MFWTLFAIQHSDLGQKFNLCRVVYQKSYNRLRNRKGNDGCQCKKRRLNDIICTSSCKANMPHCLTNQKYCNALVRCEEAFDRLRARRALMLYTLCCINTLLVLILSKVDTFLLPLHISSAKKQKDVNTMQWCFIEKQKCPLAIDFERRLLPSGSQRNIIEQP